MSSLILVTKFYSNWWVCSPIQPSKLHLGLITSQSSGEPRFRINPETSRRPSLKTGMEPCCDVLAREIEVNIDTGIKHDALLSLNVNGKIIY